VIDDLIYTPSWNQLGEFKMGHDPSRFDIFPAGLPDEIKQRVVKLAKDMGVSQQQIFEEAIKSFDIYRTSNPHVYDEYDRGKQISIRLRKETKQKMLERAGMDNVTAKTVMCSAIERLYKKTYG